MSAEGYFALAERCEAATGPDRALGREVLLACGKGFVSPLYRWLDPTASLDAAMTLVPEGLELAIYTQWALTEGYPENEDGSVTITDDMPRGCWVRTWGLSESGGTKNIRGYARSNALAVTAIALRARAAQEQSR